ncbi:hypothetical protein R3P38DRAFT_3356239 [Favolaschia claudopus]|uniref:Uncharacterized protein n=1 Tax=Favolaschia claudopus TaxID=2862362 RepID=A0AAW0BGP7_9AGAR
MKTCISLALVGIVSILDIVTAAPIDIASEGAIPSAAAAASAAVFTASSAGEVVAATPSAVLSSVRAAPHTAALFAYPASRNWSSAFRVSSTTSSNTAAATPTSDVISVTGNRIDVVSYSTNNLIAFLRRNYVERASSAAADAPAHTTPSEDNVNQLTHFVGEVVVALEMLPRAVINTAADDVILLSEVFAAFEDTINQLSTPVPTSVATSLKALVPVLSNYSNVPDSGLSAARMASKIAGW